MGAAICCVTQRTASDDVRRRIVEIRRAGDADAAAWNDVIAATGAEAKVEQMLKHYRGCANSALNGSNNARLKSALRRIAARILNLVESAATEPSEAPAE